MKVTTEGLALIREFEGFRAAAYRDATGVWTIGYGHTSRAGLPPVTRGMIISRDEAERILAADVAQFAQGVRSRLTRPLNDQQFSALVSFAYNVGLGNFEKSSVRLAANAGDDARVQRRLALWVKAGGRTLPGLVRRRAAEAALYGGAAPEQGGATLDVPRGKPLVASKTAWAAIAGFVLLLAQWFGLLSLNGASGLLAAAFAMVLRERLRMSQQDGV